MSETHRSSKGIISIMYVDNLWSPFTMVPVTLLKIETSECILENNLDFHHLKFQVQS